MNRAERRKRVRVFDMDGTLTKLVPGGYEAYADAHAAGLALKLGLPAQTVIGGYAVARLQIAANPNSYGWDVAGKRVAPALVDHFVAVQVTACAFLEAWGEDPSRWEAHLNALYAEHYLKLSTEFRPEMMEVFREIRERGDGLHIVSNSDPAKIVTRFKDLGPEADWIHPLIVGFAKKMIVTGEQARVLPGFPRAVWFERDHYKVALDAVLAQHPGSTYEDMDVIGDGFELDGLVPLGLGARFFLLEGPNTPEYEKEWLRGDPSLGRVITNLREVLDD